MINLRGDITSGMIPEQVPYFYITLGIIGMIIFYREMEKGEIKLRSTYFFGNEARFIGKILIALSATMVLRGIYQLA